MTGAEVHSDYARLLRESPLLRNSTEAIGDRTARWMEQLGGALNALDAGSPDDAWLYPIFEKAHEFWPVPSASRHIETPEDAV